MTQREDADGDVYPVHIFDNLKLRRIFVARVLHFNDVLDAGKLQSSLTRLLEIGDWRKLGGLCVEAVDDKHKANLEIHVPKRFTAAEPAFTFAHNDMTRTSIHDHPTLSRLHPSSAAHAAILPVPKGKPPFAAPAGYPTTVDEMIRRRLPQLLVYTTSFRDATLVSVVWPHTVSDACGVLHLLRNWSLVVGGRQDHVSSMLGARSDIIVESDKAEPVEDREPLGLETWRLSGWPMVKWIARFAWRWARSPPVEPRTVFVPRDAMAALLARIQAEVAAMPTHAGAATFASEGDMLTAWIVHTISASEGCKRPMAVSAFYNMRPRLPRAADGGVYVQNMLALTFALVTAAELRGPVGPVAVTHRRHVARQTTPAQVRSFARTQRRDVEATGSLRLLFGDAAADPILVNNFLKAGFLTEVDFGAAVVRTGDAARERSNPPGTAVAYDYDVDSPPLRRLMTFYMLGKDHAGNYWFQGNLRARAWDEMETRLTELGAGPVGGKTADGSCTMLY
ncbi:alpha-1,2-mannosidase family [Cordyceps militaris]|uniref:Alpha-1,2-mannosidase family n=1 Tax=Cordyceps militaris TaxID=73501 RepID=A0A2H4SA54_CORMI|nr:alpha-1,2-mannosidase family [Cordyceps militaris]